MTGEFPLKRRLLYSGIILFFATGFPVHAQQTVRFSHLTVKEGLSQGSVSCILQDRKGFIWFGTFDGLNRYDGYKFTIYRHAAAEPGSINGNFIVMIAEDSAGDIWAGTNDHPDTLNRFDPRTETFSQFPAAALKIHGAAISAARSRYEDRSGTLWEAIKNGGLRRANKLGGETKTYRHSQSDPGSLIDDNVYQIAEDLTGNLWITTSGGIEKFNPRTEKFTHYTHDPKNPNSLSDNETWPLLVDRGGRIWVGTFQGGLERFDPTTESFEHFTHDESNPGSLAGNRLYSLYQDRSGLIWVGTGDHGVEKFHPDMSPFHNYTHQPGESSLSDNNIQSIDIDKAGIAWIGTTRGLNRLDRGTGRISQYLHNPKDPKSIADDVAPALLVDRNGALWVGTTNNGLDRMDGSTFIHYKHNAGDSTSLSEDEIYALLEDRQGDIWIGTYAGGLDRLTPGRKGFKAYRHNPGNPASLASESIWSLLQDRDGVLWVGTNGSGLDRFHRDMENFDHYINSDADSTTISDDYILSLYEDRAGRLWVGTMGGLNLLDRQSGKFTRFREKDGLANDNVFGILEDRQGNLWMSTVKGISRFDSQTRKFHTYDYTDGLQGNEYNQGAYGQDPRTGEMYFGGGNGFTLFNPEHVTTNAYVPQIVVSSFLRYNTDDREGRPIPEKGISVRPGITVSYKDNITSFEFAALSYYNNFKNQYAYRLEGFNDNWIHLGTDRRATFTNLNGGDYILRVRGSNNDGIWNDEGTSLNFTVTPPWWKTTWAYSGYVFLFVGFLYTARRAEINRREQKARVRESELRAKAVEAEKRALQAENDRKTKELEDARLLQLSMLPREIPKIPGYDIAVVMKTATEVGGDYYDFAVSKDGVLNVAFGDATGHGMQAGTIVTLMKGLFISDAAKFDIQSFFNHCSRAIKDIKLGRLYMAMTLARFNGINVSLSSAGMPPVYVYRSETGAIDEILLKAVPLGSMKNFPYGLYETAMHRGDVMLFLTDGLPEQKNSSEDMFDYARVVEKFKNTAAGTPADIVSRLIQEADTWLNGAVQDDDITLLVVKKTE